jgi:outer membrane protein assembly factor BamA
LGITSKSFTFETNLNSYLLKNNIIILIILFGITIGFSSCNTVKYVDENEHLLTKNTIYVNEKKDVSDEINDYIVQRPNQLVLGIPLPLHFYNIGNKNYESDYDLWKIDNANSYKFTKRIFSEKQTFGLRKFKSKVHAWWLSNGEAPIILDANKTQQTLNNLRQYYLNEGYYKVSVSAKNNLYKKSKATVDYYVDTNKPYTLDSVLTNIESKVLDSIYKNSEQESFIKTGNQFKFSYFLDEQNRLTRLFRNSGIYRFTKNAINFEADSTNAEYKSDVTIIINDSIGDVPFKIQKIKEVNIYTDYSYNSKDDPIKDSLIYNGYNFKAFKNLKYNPKLLLNSVFIEPNDLYNDENRELTRKHIRGLSNFRSVEINYTELPDDNLVASIRLTPLKKYSLGFNTELTHSNIRQLGTSGKLSFLNRNVFKGAEILKFSIQGSYFLDSKDAANNEKLLNAWEIGGDISLELPRFFLPFNPNMLISKSKEPKTTFTLGTSLQKNIGLDKQKFTGIIDYTWESDRTQKHSLELFNTQFIKNLNIESYFDIYRSEFLEIEYIASTYFGETINTREVIDFIDTNIDSNFEQSNPVEFNTAQNVKNRHDIITEDVLIPSIVYTYTFNNSENYKDTDFSFFRTRLVSSGNFTTMLAKKNDQTNVKTLFDTPIAQFIRTDLEYKKFWNFSLENVLAFRSFVGIAVPYNNSSTIPFSRSYSIGGPNDLRAWKIYDLGPGASQSGLEYNVGTFKFLTSLEYRFKILNSIKGALFIDSGNIWDITNSSVTKSDEKFNGFSSIEDIAVGSGFGIRYDLSFILLRLDLGFKTYEPYLTQSNKWFVNYNFSNTVYNFGISYPF